MTIVNFRMKLFKGKSTGIQRRKERDINSGGLQTDVVYPWPTNSALVYEPKCWGGGEGVAGSQPMSTAVHRRPNKLWRSNSIFNLCIKIFYSKLSILVSNLFDYRMVNGIFLKVKCVIFCQSKGIQSKSFSILYVVVSTEFKDVFFLAKNFN